jgi:two-component system response regulator HydG
MPPLRGRVDDIPVLVDHFLARFATAGGRPHRRMTTQALATLQQYDWPGNVRELENAIERAAVLCQKDEIGPELLPARIVSQKAAPLVSDRLPPNPSLEIIERAYIHWVLESEGGNKTRAAEVLGIDPSTLYRKLLRYGLSE